VEFVQFDVAACGGISEGRRIADIVSGLGLSENARSLLMTREWAEVARFAVYHGAQLLTLAGLAGMGDLVVTCSSVHSRNFRVGQGLAVGRPLPDILRELGMVAEGVRTTRTVHRVARREGLDMPITATMTRVLDGELDVRRARPGRRWTRIASSCADM
jgi:glycerol-3-phosphate dehydrogenase (NAD(P)+)